jgi:hypothetical protein
MVSTSREQINECIFSSWHTGFRFSLANIQLFFKLTKKQAIFSIQLCTHLSLFSIKHVYFSAEAGYLAIRVRFKLPTAKHQRGGGNPLLCRRQKAREPSPL